MTGFEDDGPTDVPDFDDPAYDDLRALLADAAAPAVMPTEVAARLDATLADLVAGTAANSSTVVPLRRRRPLGRRLLVAAAVIAVVGAGGIGVAQVLDSTGGSDSFSSSTAQRDSAAEAPPAPGVLAPESTGDTAGSSGGNLLRDQYSAAQRLAVTEFTTAGFAKQVSHFVDVSTGRSADSFDAGPPPTEPSGPTATPELTGGSGSVPAPATGSGPEANSYDQDLRGLSAATKADSTCAGPTTPAGAVSLPITFEGRPGVLVLHPVVAGARYAAAWSCDGHQLLAYATIPA